MFVNVIFFLFILIPAEKDLARDIVELKDHIATVNAQLIRLERQKSSSEQRHRELVDRLPEMELNRARLIQEIKKADLHVKLISAEKQANRERQDELRKKLESVEKIMGSRLREVYKKGPMGYSQAFLKESEIESMVSSFYYVEHITRKDQALFYKFLDLRKTLVQAETELEQLEENGTKRVKELTLKKKEMNTLLKKRKREISVLFNKTRERTRLLEKLKTEKRELSELIGNLQSGKVENTDTPYIPITHYKGRLDWPVGGRLLRRFGVFRDAQFSTKRKQNGIDIASVKGQEVKTVYGGKVIFADWFKSYGNLLIIDHGRQYVSFYAHNDTLLVEKGDVVERNQTIALAGDSGSLQGSFLHFEIREGTKPDNPLKWLKKRK